MKITVDQTRCCGTGQCVLIAPDIFDQRETDGIVLLLDDSPQQHLHPDIRQAAGVCPASAINLTES